MYPLPVYNGNTRARRMGPPRAFSFTQGNQPSLLFDAMGGTIVLGRGGQAPTFTRATVATVTDQDLAVRQVLSGEVRFGGFRRVQNLFTGSSEVLTNGAWALFGGASRTASTVTFSASGTDSIYQAVLAGATGSVNRVFVVRAKVSHASATKGFRFRLTQSGVIDYTSGDLTATTTPQIFSALFTVASAAGTGLNMQIMNSSDAAAGTITLQQLQFEEVTGQSNQNPAEYVSVGVLSTPYQGANVDGVQYFPYLNGNTVASNVVTEARGANINGNSNFGALPGASGAYFSTPDSVASSITGDIDLRVKVALNNWASGATQILLAKDIAGQFSYDMYVSTTGNLVLRISLDGGTGAGLKAYSSSAIIPATNGVMLWVRATRNATTGDGTFYTSQDGVTWTQLGTVQANTAGAIFDGTDILEVGANTTGTTNLASGKFYRAQIYNGIAGTLAVDFNPNSWTSGASWVSATGETWTINGGASVVAVSLGGYLPEPAATDLLTARADARDMTTANWTLGATMTRARTSVGADGVANKATRLTGGAVAATNIITTTITAAASSRTYSVLIKRVTGTGPVRITQDNFATSTDISSLINSSTFTLVQINQSQLNAVLGIKIDTNGDAIDADWNQFSAGDLTGLVNSRIPDTISTRNADVLTYATTGWLNASAGTLYVEFFNSTNTGASAISAVLNNGTANNFVRTYRSSTGGTAFADVADGGVTQSNLSVGAVATGAVQRITSVYQANDFTGFVNNTSLGTDVAGTIPALTQLDIGHQNGGSLLGHYVRKVAYYPIRMVNESAKALTA